MPTLLVQMLLVQPVALVVLDRLTGRGDGVRAALRRLATNPLTIAALLGLVLALTGWDAAPDRRCRRSSCWPALAIPAMLLSYGAALRLSPWPGRAGHNREVLVASVLKLGVMPVVAWSVGTALGLEGRVLLGVVITAALPTAQNIFLHATRYRDRARTSPARRSCVTTLASLPVALLIAVLLG